jgi:hypothetical protein
VWLIAGPNNEEREDALMSGHDPNFKSENKFQTALNLICSKGYVPKL